MIIFLLVFLLLTIAIDGKNTLQEKKTLNGEQKLQTLCPEITNERCKKNYDDYYSHCDCELGGLGIIQKIPYNYQILNLMNVQFSSACVRCGLCLVIAEKINKTLMEIHDATSSDQWLNGEEADTLLQIICNESFLRYRLREINNERYIGEDSPGSTIVESNVNGLWATNLKIKCNDLLETISSGVLYKYWKEHRQKKIEKNLTMILCNGDMGKLRDCRGVTDISHFSRSNAQFKAGVKINAAFNCMRQN